jgi:hypothetical protein
MINVALKAGIRARGPDRTEHQPEEYWAAHEARTRLSAETAALEDIVADLKERAAHDRRLKAEERRRVTARLQSLPAVERFPEGDWNA